MTKIEWVRNAAGERGKTWNPIVGCSIVSPGCTNCYAMKMAARIDAMWRAGSVDENGYAVRPAPGSKTLEHYDGLTKRVNGKPVWTGKLALAPEHILLEPLKRRKPTTYFVNSMGDLFHEDCPDEWIDKVFAVMALCPQHIFQVLTKRSARMREYMSTPDRKRIIAHDPVLDISDAMARVAGTWKARPSLDHFSACFAGHGPFPNVWLGVSAERQQEADERIPDLLATPAAIRFVSLEPLLGPIDLTDLDHTGMCRKEQAHGISAIWKGNAIGRASLDWVIVGGESGPDARPMHPDWARSLRDQCAAAGVPFFFKQWGEWAPYDRGQVNSAVLATPGSLDTPLQRFGKKAAGRLLDGREHNEMPA